MPVAFVISTAEEEIVNAVSEGAPKPHMNGNLFSFAGKDVPEFMNRVSAHGAQYDFGTPEFRASLRLVERLGTWIGRNIAASKPASDQLELPLERQEVPLDDPESEEVSPSQRRKRTAS